MSRFARNRRVFFVEEPEYTDTGDPSLKSTVCPTTGVHVVTPVMPQILREKSTAVITEMLQRFFRKKYVDQAILWLYTPMALDVLPNTVSQVATIYDCMDELSLFRGAPERLRMQEEELLSRADIVFTGGVSLFEAKRARHPNVHAFPSGVDVLHFARARNMTDDHAEHQTIPRPRLGYAGVIDERLDLQLLQDIAERRPQWQLVMIGPVVKIDSATLPRANNIHWLGMKDYRDLPAYFSGWDVALMPFAINDATRFISPTKTPEYLSAGLPVVSTPIRDVVRPYGELGLVRIGTDADEFIAAAEQMMAFGMSLKWRERADHFLQSLSWDAVWHSMDTLLRETLQSRAACGRKAAEKQTSVEAVRV